MSATEQSAFFERIRLNANPVANPRSVVISEQARFTVLTARLLRLEWSATSQFEDRPSFAFPTRFTPDEEVPDYTTSQNDGWLVIDTGALLLRYRLESGQFTAENLEISLKLNGQVVTWRPGTANVRNLRGTRRTLDECVGDVALEEGLISRDGWALFDDSEHVLFDEQDWWVEPRPENVLQDWYFFGYGHDYKAAVAEYTRFGGQIPLIPRYVLGAWWSRYWAYSDQDLKNLVNDFVHYDLPLDVLVLDMDWHTEDSWTGYTWNRKLFPDPAGFLKWVHEHGLRTTLNLHPAEGVQPFEEVYPGFCEVMGIDPATRQPIPFQVADKRFMQHYFELLHHPLEDIGVDFWWMDWQQGQASEVRGLDPLPWLNHLHFLDSTRRGERAMLYSRWGGLGNHRYHIGFSGDTYSVWEALQFQPYFTATSANVAYGWWSHDIGGHLGATEPELMARWIQFGALSPCLRLHSSKQAEAERRPWAFTPEVLQASRQAYHLRYQLEPYLYTEGRVAMDSSLALCRPMYYEHPEEEAAYIARYQYYLGDQLIAAPMVFPADPVTGQAAMDVWVPEGVWTDYQTRESFEGPRWVHLTGDLERIPLLVKAGSILPQAPLAETTDAIPKDKLILRVFPGKEGRYRFYEDDGLTEAYHRGEFEWTTITMRADGENACEIRVEPVEGNCPVLPPARSYEVYLEATHKPAAIYINGQPLAEWRYDLDTLQTIISVSSQAKDQALTIRVEAGEGQTLFVLGTEYNQVAQLATTREILGAHTPAVPFEQVTDAVLALDAPGKADALARLGGPFVRFIEYITPEEVQQKLCTVIAGAPANQESYDLKVTWKLYRNGGVEEYSDQIRNVREDRIIYSPFTVTEVQQPMYWTVEVELTWRGKSMNYSHRSKPLFPAISAWRSVVYNEHNTPLAPADLLDAEGKANPNLRWRNHIQELFSVKSIADPFYMRLREWYQTRLFAGETLAGYALATIISPDDREAVMHFHSPGPIQFFLNGEEVAEEGPVAGTDLEGAAFHPRLSVRSTHKVQLHKGRNNLIVSTRSPEGRPHWWLSVVFLRPDGSMMTDLTTERDLPGTPPDSEDLIGI
ncbi:MAG TPA: TIM-barrel domain-containing protein [Chloroflexia bacterium]|nr:TIM-barrel domain-containing protein [Chloroflexia bacterium]